MSDAFGAAMSEQAATWRAIMQGPTAQEPAAMKNEITLDPGAEGADRRAVAAYLAETAARTLTAGGPLAELVASCIAAIGTKLTETPAGPVVMKVNSLDRDQRVVVRRVLYVAADRAKSGLADVGLAVKEGIQRLLEAWEHAIGYDPEPSWPGRRNQWGEPDNSPGRLFASAGDRGWVS